MQIRFHVEAEAELNAARVWYGLQREGLGSALMHRVDEALGRILDAPYSYPVVYRQLRRAIIRQFPFAIFYESRPDEIFVFAVYHSRRNPERLRQR